MRRSPSTARRAPKRETAGTIFDRSVNIAGLLIISGGMEETISGTPRQTGITTIAGLISSRHSEIQLYVDWR